MICLSFHHRSGLINSSVFFGAELIISKEDSTLPLLLLHLSLSYLRPMSDLRLVGTLAIALSTP